MVDIDPPSHLRIVLSGIAGSSSLACWIVLLLPQLIEQWRLKSADGISIGFIVIWLFGDVTNLAGSVWANLRPEVILLAVWYCFADSLILLSYFYYKRLAKLREERKINKHKHHRNTGDEEEDPTAPLLNRRNSANRKISNGSIEEHLQEEDIDNNEPHQLVQQPHHHHHHHHHNHNRRDSLSSIVIETSNSSSIFSRIVLPVVFVLASGVLGYFISGNDENSPPDNSTDEPLQLGPQILGYTSAILYLSARIPQILQNYQRRSTHGLSLVFFIFSILGNLTYSLGILIYRTDSKWIQLYFPWLLGSLGTIFEDIIIFVQFYLYDQKESDDPDSAISSD